MERIMEQQKFEFEVRDMRHKEKFEIDDIYLNGYAKKCGVYATGVYISLCRHANNKTQECWPSIRKIAEELNISQVMVQKSLKILEKSKIILKKQTGKGLNNRYILLDKSMWIGVSQGNTGGVSPQTSQCITTDKSLRIPIKDYTLRIGKIIIKRKFIFLIGQDQFMKIIKF